VLIFFGLSGFILHTLLSDPVRAGGKVNLKAYFWRRVTRLEPPYIVATTVILLAALFSGYQTGGQYFGKGPVTPQTSYLLTLGYMHTLTLGIPPSFNPPGWSLETEVQFYLLAPCLVWGLYKLKSSLSRIVLLGATILVWPTLVTGHASSVPQLSWSLAVNFPFFASGILCCECLRQFDPKSQTVRSACDLGALLGLGLLIAPLKGLDYVWVDLLRCAAIFLLLAGAMRGNLVKRFLSLPFVAITGGMCYSIYLVHLPSMEVLTNLMMKHMPAPKTYLLVYLEQCVCVLPVVLLISSTFYLLIERPCMNKKWPQDLWRRLTGRSAGKSEVCLPVSLPTGEAGKSVQS
jgi:peptidoglycan/LPS O-acetylase OafA/YrhL